MKRGKRICNTLKDVRIQFTNGSVTEYVYSATGQKLGVEYRVAAPNTSVTFGVEPDALTLGQTVYAGSTQYLLGGSLVVKDGLTDRYLFDGGYAKASAVNPTAYSFEFHYYNRDHLGNNREVVDSAGVVEQVTNYYPFGTPYTQSAAVMNANMQPYKFNGKELDDETGLYYYGARYYDPKLSVWYSTDPMHNIKPLISDYSYCFNNPFSITDPSGMLESTDVIKNNDGTYRIVGVHNDGDNNIYIVNQKGVRTGKTIGSTIRPYDFMGTNDKNGTFINKAGIIIDLNNLYVSGKVLTENAEYSIYHADANDLLDWGMTIFREELKFDSYRTFYSELLILEKLSKNGEALDIKRSMGLDPYTPIRAGTNSEGKPIITTLRAVGNYLFGVNVKSTKPFLFPNDLFYKSVMKKVGKYNQQQNHGNGYNPGFPYYGEHTYSGSFIYYGYYGRFY